MKNLETIEMEMFIQKWKLKYQESFFFAFE